VRRNAVCYAVGKNIYQNTNSSTRIFSRFAHNDEELCNAPHIARVKKTMIIIMHSPLVVFGAVIFCVIISTKIYGKARIITTRIPRLITRDLPERKEGGGGFSSCTLTHPPPFTLRDG